MIKNERGRPAKAPPVKPLATYAFTAVRPVVRGEAKANTFVDIAGVVRNFKVPMSSRGGDYKSTITIVDRESEETIDRLDMHLFIREEKNIPKVGALDVVVVRRAKVQYRDTWSLLSNDGTVLTVVPHTWLCRAAAAADKGRPLAPEGVVQWTRAQGLVPVATLDTAVLSKALAVHTEMQRLLETQAGNTVNVIQDIKAKAAQSANDKWKTVAEVQPRMYAHLTVQLVADRIETASGAVALWVSDYTRNASLKHREPGGDLAGLGVHLEGAGAGAGRASNETQPGDQFGYLTEKTRPHKSTGKGEKDARGDWKGPAGRQSILVMCYDENAQLLRDHDVKRGTWVNLLNVQFRTGTSSVYLEGFMHGDPQSYRDKVEVVDMEAYGTEDGADAMPKRLREALERKRAYMALCKKYLKQQRRLRESRKRKALDEGDTGRKLNSKQRRQMERAQMHVVANAAVVCEGGSEPTTALGEVLDAKLYRTLAVDARRPLPFVNCKFKAQVRCVDFLPHRLADFARPRWVSDTDVLALGGRGTDASLSMSDTDDSESEADVFGRRRHADPSARQRYEWRFALLLEDASVSTVETHVVKRRVWATVAHDDADMLLDGLEACDLAHERHAGTLAELREKMFLLWGNLEETKRARAEQAEAEAARQHAAEQAVKRKAEAAAAAQARAREAKAQKAASRMAAGAGALRKYPAPEPPSSDRGESEAEAEVESEPETANAVKNATVPELSNMAFQCCLRQFGVWTKPVDDTSAPKAWQQSFGLFATMIKDTK